VIVINKADLGVAGKAIRIASRETEIGEVSAAAGLRAAAFISAKKDKEQNMMVDQVGQVMLRAAGTEG